MVPLNKNNLFDRIIMAYTNYRNYVDANKLNYCDLAIKKRGKMVGDDNYVVLPLKRIFWKYL